jgi:2-iminobutanoate/2-iminopropanoate deaminase
VTGSPRRPAAEPIRRHHSDGAPAAIGPYSQAVSVAGVLYTSGQVGLDPESGDLVDGGFEAQAEQVFRNLARVLESAGAGFADVLKATVYLADMADFPTLNRIYAAAFGEHKPARSTVQAAGLPKGARVEIDLVARLPS